MIKRFYGATWFLLAAAVLISVSTNTLNPSAMVVFGLVALGLILSLGLWTATVNSQEIKE